MGRVKSHSNHQPYKYHNPSSKIFHQSSYQRKSPFAKIQLPDGTDQIEEKKSEPKTSTPPFLINEELPTATAAADSARKPSPVMANGFQKTLSKTSLLVNFLPTGTLLTFETLVPTFYRGGSATCNRVTTLMLTALLTLCAFSCFFFHFTDSFRGPDGRVYFGFVKPWGLAAFNPGIEEPKDEKYRLGVADIVHAVMSALVFLAIAFSDHRVSGCLFPGHEKEIDEVMDQGLPLIIGIVCSALFLVFVKDRHGIGCLEAAA